MTKGKAEGTRWEVYKRTDVSDSFWYNNWIVQPPGADFEDSYAFDTWRRALQYATDQATGRRQ